MTEPTLRKPVGVLLILAIIFAWAIVVIAVSPYVLQMGWPVQAAFFAIAGLAWIVPLKPLLRWMEAGRER